jgi:hypothetical protein
MIAFRGTMKMKVTHRNQNFAYHPVRIILWITGPQTQRIGAPAPTLRESLRLRSGSLLMPVYP